ncbi:MAG: TolC family protein [Burkholderiales bacterium]|nr:TolC family protein [Burkholderiales bacterium]
MNRWAWIACALWVAAAQAQQSGRPLTLDDAWMMAEERNASLVASHAAVSAAQASAEAAGALLWNNPEVSAGRSRRAAAVSSPGGATVREWSAGLAQAIEIGGQRTHRLASARRDLEAATWQAEQARRELRAEVERRFVRVVALQARIAIERDSLALVENTADFAGRRVDAGEDSRLDGNLAIIEAARARNQLASLGDQLLQARVELGEIVQWPHAALPEAVGDLEAGPGDQTLESLLAGLPGHASLRALRAREDAARSRVDLERAARLPDVTLGLTVAREGPAESREKVTTLSLSVPLPLFRNNSAGVAQAGAELVRAEAERRAAARDAEAALTALWTRSRDLAARVATLRTTVLPALAENQSLSQRALREGEIGLVQQIVVNRQLLDGRRDLLEAMTDLRLARIALRLASGATPSPASRQP